MAVFGYVRENFPIETIEQITLVLNHPCDEIYLDSNHLQDESELTRLTNKLSAGDTIVVANFQVFGRTIKHLAALFDEFNQKNIIILSCLDQMESSQQIPFSRVLQLLSDNELSCSKQKIKMRIHDAKEQGTIIGRPKLDADVIEQIYHLYNREKQSLRYVAKTCGVSLGSAYKYAQTQPSGKRN